LSHANIALTHLLCYYNPIDLDHKFIENYAVELGLPEPMIALFKISSGANINKALLAETIDFGARGLSITANFCRQRLTFRSLVR